MEKEKDRLFQVIGDELKRLRIDAGYSQEQLALESGLDRTFISLLERGLRQPSIRTLFTIADTLKIQPSAIILSIEQRRP